MVSAEGWIDAQYPPVTVGFKGWQGRWGMDIRELPNTYEPAVLMRRVTVHRTGVFGGEPRGAVAVRVGLVFG